MIDPIGNDIGRVVIYVPGHAQGDQAHKDCERGEITAFNHHCVFVKYAIGRGGIATNRFALHWEVPREYDK